MTPENLSTKQLYGFEWEVKLVEKLLPLGEVEHLSQICWTHEFDIKLNGKLIHCKVAKSRKQHAHGRVFRNRFQFNFRGIVDGDFIIAICDKYGEPVHFIIPVAELTKKSLSITSHPLIYKGWAAKYRENWSVLNGTN